MTLGILFAVGFVAGFINAVAGGGSFITIPTLILAGLPPTMANATNRVSIVFQNISGIAKFKTKGVSSFKLSGYLAIFSLAGAWIGTRIAVTITDTLFNYLLVSMMLISVAVVFWSPAKRSTFHVKLSLFNQRWVSAVAFFFIGIYGGFINAGIGYVILSVIITVYGVGLNKANNIKLTVTLFYTVFSLGIFMMHGMIDWAYGLAMAAGSASGAWVSTHIALKRGDTWIRFVLVVTVLALSVKLLLLN